MDYLRSILFFTMVFLIFLKEIVAMTAIGEWVGFREYKRSSRIRSLYFLYCFLSCQDHITPLMIACTKGDLKIVDSLIKEGADIGLEDAVRYVSNLVNSYNVIMNFF